MNSAGLLARPVVGGVFGTAGRYVLATVPCVVRGLHAVRFMVVEPASGAVLSLADGKAEALAGARHAIRENERLAIEASHARGVDPRQHRLWPDEVLPVRPVVDKTRPVSKRRRDVFAKCHGRCHYCGGPLVLAGPGTSSTCYPRLWAAPTRLETWWPPARLATWPSATGRQSSSRPPRRWTARRDRGQR